MAELTNSPAPKAKLESIMEAASALTALAEEESTGAPSPTPMSKMDAKSPSSEDDDKAPRYIPEHKKPDAALTFPEKMMNLMRYAVDQNQEGFCVAWLPDGKSFVIRNPDTFTRQVLPKFFKATKFSSFTRKLYRWGFRQVNRGIGPDDPIIFGNDNFQRDSAQDMTQMRSITAASSRKAEAQTIYGGAKLSLDGSACDGPDHKRAFLDHLLQQKAASYMHPNHSMYAGLNAPGGAVSLTSALRPSMGLGMAQNHYNGGLPAMMSQHMQNMNHQQGSNGSNTNNLMGDYMPRNSNPSQHVPQQSYANGTSTVDIVNAAISALRYAS